MLALLDGVGVTQEGSEGKGRLLLQTLTPDEPTSPCMVAFATRICKFNMI